MDSSNTESCGTAACESLASQPLVGSARPATDTVFHIEKMDCPSEELQIRQRVGQIAGVEALGFDLQHHRLTVTHRLAGRPIGRAGVELLKAVGPGEIDVADERQGALGVGQHPLGQRGDERAIPGPGDARDAAPARRTGNPIHLPRAEDGLPQ